MKTILITGSTDGIGKLAAIKLAKGGQEIILHGRNKVKLERTIEEVRRYAQNENISGFVSDLADFESIHEMIASISKSISKIDVLINNAGVYNSNVQYNDLGLDMRFAVNYFAPVLLTNGLIQLLNQSASPRIINLSSAAQASVSIEALKGTMSISQQNAYAQSKLALTIWSFHMSKRYPRINTIALNPGSLLDTNMVKEAFGHHWSPADKGGNIISDLAMLEKYNNSSGKYFDNDIGSFAKAHSDAYDTELIERLLFETEKILNK